MSQRDFHITVHKVEYRLVSNFDTQADAHIEAARICNKMRKDNPSQEFWFDVEMVEEEGDE